jgi:hypothetical protein
MFKESELEEGQDNSLICRGYDGFILQIDALAMYNALHVTKKNSGFSLSQTPILSDYRKGVVEWRMANMKPFAIIVRSLDMDKNGDAISERLVVIGLKGFEFISDSVKAKGNPRANEQARSLADTAYSTSTPMTNKELSVAITPNPSIKRDLLPQAPYVKR